MGPTACAGTRAYTARQERRAAAAVCDHPRSTPAEGSRTDADHARAGKKKAPRDGEPAR
ncbi:hypothetical protein [Deinococcus hopiensis]|uniref:hypothetical protein n=1 Tax=Deinococcus hopiensis TaxID=309885 RepID=UPI001BAEE9D0|nr:hypothetical protein [Deinococcus hopiensis]